MVFRRSFLVALAVSAGLSTQVAAPQGQRNLTPEQRAERERRLQEELTMPRPIPALDSIWIEELTWIEIRDAIASGKTTAIVPTGGIEQNGPYVAMGKHNYILQTACEDIARELGNALCAPIIKLVPEGNIEKPSGHMRYSGTISVREETFEAMLEDVGNSLKAHGFENVVYIGDSGGNQDGMAAVAERLSARWADARAHHIAGFYDNDGVIAYMNKELGIAEPKDDGFHDSYWITALQMVTDPATVRYEERVAAGKASINGVSIANLDETVAVGRKLMKWRVDRTVQLIREAIGTPSGTQH
ncbi:MAG TPA: creatininase family protein [Vicinamibacteria bacterium]|nr:creatininase family protein [Vicinamibacteria bacterium]